MNNSNAVMGLGEAPCPDIGSEPCTPCVNPMDSMALSALPIAMAYIPMQKWGTLYSVEKGLERGTMFQDLDLPFCGRRLR